MPMPSRIIAKPKMPMPRFRNMLSRNMAGSSMPVTGIRTPGVALGVGVGLAGVPQSWPLLVVFSDLVAPVVGSTHMIATVFGSGPSTGVSKVNVLLEGTTIGPPEALPPTIHQTKDTSAEFALLTCQRSVPGVLLHSPTRVRPLPVTGMKGRAKPKSAS